jgi:hypothetical protein
MNSSKKGRAKWLARLAFLRRQLGSKPNPIRDLTLANYLHRGSISDSGS